MRTSIAIALFFPTLIAAQDSVRQQAAAAAPQKWRDDQAALAAASAAQRPKRWEQTEKGIVDLERKEKAVMQALADVFRDSDPQGTDARFIRDEGRTRRPRIEADEASSIRLDSIRQAGHPDAILTALQLRRNDADKSGTLSDSLVVLWKEVLQRSQRVESRLRADDKPSNPANLKAFIRAAIDHHERLMRLCRAAIDFESKRGKELHAEAAALDQQIAAGKTATGTG